MHPRRETVKALEEEGYTLIRKGAKHDIYFSKDTKKTIPVKRHDFDEDDARYIRKEAGLPKR